jgi:hypothetical protein
MIDFADVTEVDMVAVETDTDSTPARQKTFWLKLREHENTTRERLLERARVIKKRKAARSISRTNTTFHEKPGLFSLQPCPVTQSGSKIQSPFEFSPPRFNVRRPHFSRNPQFLTWPS